MRAFLATWLRAFAWAAAIAVLLAAALAALLFAVSNGWQRERVRAWTEAGLADALGREVEIGSLEGNLHETLALRDVTIGAGDASLHLDSLEAELDLSALWRERRVTIGRLVLTGPEIRLERRSDASWHVAGLLDLEPSGAAEGDATAAPVTFEIASLVVHEGRLELAWHDAAETSRVRGLLALEVDALRWPPGPGGMWPERAVGSLELEPSTWRGRRVESGRLAARLEGRTLRVEPSRLAGDFGRLDFDGDGELAATDAPFPLRRGAARLRLASLDLAPLLGEPQLASRLTGAGKLTLADPGTAARAPDLDVGFRLGPSRLGPAQLEAVEVRGTFRPAGPWRIVQASVVGDAGRIELAGHGTAQRMETLSLRADGLELGRLPEPWRPAGVTGRVDVRAELAGAWGDPTGTIRLSGSGLQRDALGPVAVRLEGEALGGRRYRVDAFALSSATFAVESEGPARLRLDGSAVELETLRLVWPGGAFELAGRIEPEGPRPLRIDVRALDVAAASTAFGGPAELEGRLTAQLLARGRWRRPELEGAGLWESARLGPARAERVQLELHSQGATLRATARLIDAGRERLHLDASLPHAVALRDPGSLLEHPETRLDLRGDALDVAWLARAVPRELAQLSGQLDTTVQLHGGRPEPRVEGSARLSEARVTLPALGTTFGPAQGSLRLLPERIELESLRIASGEGEANLAGGLDWTRAGPGAAQLEASFRSFTISRTRTLQAELDGALRLTGRREALRLNGELTLLDAEVTLPEQADPLMKEVQVLGLPEAETPLEIRETPAPPSDLWHSAAADLTFRVPRNTWVRGRGADVEIAGELRVLKKANEPPAYVGSLEVVRGRYRFQGRTFRVERGVATFTGSSELDPELDFVAVQRVRDVTLRAIVTGRASAPRLSLESDPPLDSSDTLSYLAFGRPAHELGSAESMRIEATATQLAGQLVAGGVASALGPALPLDLFNVGVGNGGTSATLEVGKYVSEDVFVRYGRGFGSEDADHVRIEWRFRPRWSLESDITSSGSSGADVIWSFDY